MGQLKWSAYQYYTSSPYEFYAACEGYFDEKKEAMLITRHSTFLIMCSNAGSKAVGDMEKWWPTKEAKPVEPLSEERRKAIFERFNIKKHGSRGAKGNRKL